MGFLATYDQFGMRVDPWKVYASAYPRMRPRTRQVAASPGGATSRPLELGFMDFHSSSPQNMVCVCMYANRYIYIILYI